MRQIIATSSGGMEEYIFELTGKENPNVCFLPTASLDDPTSIRNFALQMYRLGARPSYQPLLYRPDNDARKRLLSQDVIYVGGGNTMNLLTIWKAWGVDKLLFEAYNKGIILTGVSAGAVCWFQQCVSDYKYPELAVLDCLGFLPGGTAVHYHDDMNRPDKYREFLSQGQIAEGIAIDNGMGLHFVDEQLKAVISTDPFANAYRLQMVNGEPTETVIPTTVYL